MGEENKPLPHALEGPAEAPREGAALLAHGTWCPGPSGWYNPRLGRYVLERWTHPTISINESGGIGHFLRRLTG